jgi:hypothetical protein
VLEDTADTLRWQETYRPRTGRPGAAAGAELRLTVLEAGRRCLVGLVGVPAAPQRVYCFTPVQVGAQRGGVVVTVIDERSSAFADRLFDLVAGGIVTRTVERAVRKELDELAAACTTRIITTTAA